MTRPAHVLLDFKQLSASEKFTFGDNVIGLLTLNVGTFTAPTVSVATLTTTNTALNQAIVDAEGGDHQAVAAMHQAEELWDTEFEQTAAYVDSVAKGNVSIILLAGFNASKTETTPATTPLPPTITKVLTNQAPGSIHVELGVQQGVSFIVFVSTDATLPMFDDGQFRIAENPKVLTMLIDSGRKMDITGLPARANLFVSAVAQNTAGYGPICPPVAASTL